MTQLLAPFIPYLLMAGAALVALFGYGAHQKAQGRKEQIAKQAAADRAASDKARRIDDEVDALKPSDVREELKKWSRD